MYGPSTSAPSVRPSRLGYWIAAVLAVVAVAGAILAVVSFSSFLTEVDSFQRVPVPGNATVTFSKAGGYLLYFEGPGFSGLSSTGSVRVSIQSQDSGKQISISPLRGTQENYSLGGHSGQAVASFTIVTPGRYVVNAGIPTSPAPTDIALGPGFGASLAEAIVGLVVCILGLVGAVTIGIITGVRRGRARRLLHAWPQGMQLGTSAMPYAGPQQPTTLYPGPAAPQQPYGQYPGSAPNGPQYPGSAPSGPRYPGSAPDGPQYPAR